jgi:hypothetical protein
MLLPSLPILAKTIGLGAALGIGLAGLFIFALIIYLLFAVCLMKILQKAGKPGWIGFVPIYNTWVFFELGGKPGWLALLSLFTAIPIVGIIAGIALFVVSILVALEIAKRFGKGPGFAICLLIILPWIGYPMLAFGKAEYHGPDGAAAPSPQGAGLPPQPGVPPVANAAVVSPGVVAPSAPLGASVPPAPDAAAPVVSPPESGVITPTVPQDPQPPTPPATPPSTPPTIQ